METVEIIVYIIVTIIIGSAIFLLVVGVDARGMYDSVRGFFTPEDKVQYDEVSIAESAQVAFRLWKHCGYGAREEQVTVYVQEAGVLNRYALIDEIKKYNLCSSLSDESQDCGVRNDIYWVSGGISTPAVVKMRCNPETNELEIS